MPNPSKPRNVLLILLALLVAGLLLGAAVWRQSLTSPMEIAAVTSIEVPPGAGFNAVAYRLRENGLVSSSLPLRAWVRARGLQGAIQAGEYEVVPGTTPLQLLDKMIRGEVKQYQVRLIEGWTFSQALQAVQRSERIQTTLAGAAFEEIARLLDPGLNHPEGMLFPDTYNYSTGTTDLQILRRAHARLQSILAERWQYRIGALPFGSDYEALILASIVEKETGVADERARIAGVFIRRLELGMRLQSDPTVIYGLGESFDGNLQRTDLQAAENPYNTYRHAGLPPTPIALAGQAALDAVLQPMMENYLYFVARGDGTHYFSETLEEHNAAVSRFQRSN